MEEEHTLQSIPDDELLRRLKENRDALPERATHRSKRQIEELIAELEPRPDAPAVMRKLPDKTTLPTPGLSIGPGRVAVPVRG